MKNVTQSFEMYSTTSKSSGIFRVTIHSPLIVSLKLLTNASVLFVMVKDA